MSTRACYQFRDADGLYVVYKHHDGYPGFPGGHGHIAAAARLAWALPRFEADEFAAAFVAANKSDAGGVRLLNVPSLSDWRACAPVDIEYVYDVDGTADAGGPVVACYAVCERDGVWSATTEGKAKVPLSSLIKKLKAAQPTP